METNLTLFCLVVLCIPQLALPLECGTIFHTLINKSLHDIACMHVNGTQRDQFFPVISRQISVHYLYQIC